MRPFISIYVFVAALSVTVLACMSAVAQDKVDANVVRIKATELWPEFWKSEKTAVKKYQGKTLEVEGKIKSPLMFKFGGQRLSVVGDAKTKGEVAFLFKADSPEVKEKTKMKVGQTIVVRGKCTGGNQFGPFIEDCTIVELK